mgnify:FL=1
MKLNTLRIKHILLDKSMSRAELAEKAGVSYQRVCSYLTGYCRPSLNNLGKIAKALDVNPAEIIEMED